MGKVLVIAPHPDDETLGCGGTLLKHKANGDDIYWLLVTNIHTEHGWSAEKVAQRQQEINTVADIYGFAETFNLDFPTTKIDQVPQSDLVAGLSEVINRVKPTTIYLPHHEDIHTDHQVIFKAGISCTKNFRYPFIKRVLSYETLSETDFVPAIKEKMFLPNVFVDICPYFDQKIDIFKVFASEVMDAPGPRSIQTLKALAQLRGSRIGVDFAEAFCLLFEHS